MHNCIEEIVTFCVGKVLKFENVEEDIMNEDTPKRIGAKRKMTVNTSNDQKRRRLD